MPQTGQERGCDVMNAQQQLDVSQFRVWKLRNNSLVNRNEKAFYKAEVVVLKSI